MPRLHHSKRRRQHGLTLVELMIALVLGLVVTGGAISMFIGNRQANRATENLSRMQENSRIAFELMARSLRDAAGNPCGATLVANVLENRTTAWWANWEANAIRGYDNADESTAVAIGTGTSERVSGTDTVTLMSAGDSGVKIVKHVATAAQFTVSTDKHNMKFGDVLMACDYRQASVFQMTGPSSANETIVHNKKEGGTIQPGNCSKGLGYATPTVCTTNGTAYSFESNGFLVKLSSEAWYIGHNARGGRSLFKAFPAVNYATGAVSATTEEIVPNVTDMQLLYKTRDAANSSGTNDYVIASSIGDWSDVVAVNVELTFTSDDRISTASGSPKLERKLMHVATLRNRAP